MNPNGNSSSSSIGSRKAFENREISSKDRKTMKAWGNLGVVDTIYEEEYECSSPSLAPTPSPSPPTFHSKDWTPANGCKTDVLIRVQGTCFHLHRDPLTSRSPYLKRQLTDHNELTLAPPLNITAETFCLVAEFCYGRSIAITPFNVAALRTAAELLQMTETNCDGDENLKQLTETFFRRIVTVNKEYALIVLRSSLALLPEAETTAFLVSKCIEALRLTDEGHGVVAELFDEVVRLGAEDFKLVADSMNRRLTNHDVLYEIVDLYLQKNSSGEMIEEQKVEICNSIDCNKLSSGFLLHMVQNPRMPLRFIIRAMLAEQLHPRNSVSPARKTNNNHHHHHHPNAREDPITLGAILQRDEALRETVQLKAVMSATSSRIQSLENELDGMKKLLNETEKERSELCDLNNRLLHEKERSILSSTSAGKSASFHYGDDNKKIVGGERGSVSSLNVRDTGGRGRLLMSGTEASRNHDKMKKNIGRRLINGLKSAFRVPKQASPGEQSLSKRSGIVCVDGSHINADNKAGNSRRDEG